jgi:alkylhydroperoxidase family enzyme
MINCCSIGAYPRERAKAGESDERIRAVAGGRDAPLCTDGERAAVALSEAFTRLGHHPDQPGYPDSQTRTLSTEDRMAPRWRLGAPCARVGRCGESTGL